MVIGDFAKIYTFMAIVKERSFSKASKKLGVSQPAVTLQVKKLEENLKATLIMRKKNGIILTNEGEKFYKLCLKFEGAIYKFNEEIKYINDEKMPVVLAASSMVSECILPMVADKISDIVDGKLVVRSMDYKEILPYLLDRRCDACLVHERINNDSLIFKKVADYDVILVSNQPFDDKIGVYDLPNLVYLKEKIRTFLDDYFVKFGLYYETFNTAYVFDTFLAVKMALLYNNTKRYVAWLPKFIVEKEIENGTLFTTKVEGIKIVRPVYVAGLKENEKIVNQLAAISSNFIL